MDYQRFAQYLPALYEDWGGPAVRPRSDLFAQMLGRVEGMSSPGVLQLLNFAVACLEGDQVYCEVGCFRGSTLVGALYGQPDRRACAADNFAEFDPQGRNLEALRHNLSLFQLQDQVRFHNQDCEDFLLGLRTSRLRVGVYFYDGAHDYRSQLLGLLLTVPVLADRALIVVDDSNWPAVRQGTWDFMAARPEARLLYDLRTPGNCHPTFWNGLMVLTWDQEGRNGYDAAFLCGQREQKLIDLIYSLQTVDLQPDDPNQPGGGTM